MIKLIYIPCYLRISAERNKWQVKTRCKFSEIKKFLFVSFHSLMTHRGAVMSTTFCWVENLAMIYALH